MSTALVVLPILLGLLVIGILAVSWVLSGMVVQPKRWDYMKSLEEEMKRGGFTRAEYDALPREESYLPSTFGYDIHVMTLPRPEGPAFPDGKRRVAVIAHGYSYTLFGSVKYAQLFRKLGFDCVLSDQRNHGLSGRAPTTMGWCEAEDLATVCAYARRRFGEDCVLGTHGESMGGATVLMHAPTDESLAFVVEDCGYSSLPDQLAFDMRAVYHLPRFPFLAIASVFSRLRGGIAFRQVMPRDRVAAVKAELPMLFIHGMADDFVPSYMVFENYGAKRGVKGLLLFPGAVHACSFFTDRVSYGQRLEAFLRENEII